jgi:hypothetical protein
MASSFDVASMVASGAVNEVRRAMVRACCSSPCWQHLAERRSRKPATVRVTTLDRYGRTAHAVHVYSLMMLPDLPADNGILAQVPGQFTGAAAMSLPRADRVARDAVLTVDIEAAHVGWVRLSFTPKLAKHRGHRHWYWSAFRADAIDAPAACSG